MACRFHNRLWYRHPTSDRHHTNSPPPTDNRPTRGRPAHRPGSRSLLDVACGVLIVDGWVRPDAWHDPGSVQALCGRADDIAVARVVHSHRAGNRTTLELYLLIGSVDGVEHLEETHELTLFSDDDYRAAFESADLTVEIHPSPHPDRDRYVGVKLGSSA